MKKFKTVFALMLCMICFSIFAMGSDDETNSSTTVSGGAGSGSSSSSSAPKEDKFAGIKIEILDKKNVNSDIYNGVLMPRCNFTIKISNTSGKTIRGVKARVVVNNMFGDQINKYNLEIMEDIESGYAYTTYDKGVEINEFIDSHEEELMQLWEKAQRGERITKIIG